MNIALWLVQGLLIVAFGSAGFMKSITPIDQLADSIAWVAAVPAWMTRVAAVSELAAAAALLVLPLWKKYTFLVPLAAAGLALIMIFATILHITRSETIAPTLILGALAALLAWGRWKLLPHSEG